MPTPIHNFPDSIGDLTAVQDVDDFIRALALDIDAKVLGWGAGPLSGRPVINPSNPGNGRRGWVGPDGKVYIDTVAAWVEIGTAAAIAAIADALNAESATRAGSLNAESATRAATDNFIIGALTSEGAARTDADGVLDAKIAVVKLAQWVAGVDGQYPNFTSIPAGYKKLSLHGHLRSTRAGVAETGLRFTVNGSGIYSYVGQSLRSSGGPYGDRIFDNAISPGYLGQVTAGAGPSQVYAALEIDLVDHADTFLRQWVESRVSMQTASAELVRYDMSNVCSYVGAITQLTVNDDVGGGFAGGSTVALYGHR